MLSGLLGANYLNQNLASIANTPLDDTNNDNPLENQFRSTPQSEWQQGVYPVIYQQDPQWDNYPYAGTTFGESGCGPACLAMVYIYLTGDTQESPQSIADLATRQGYANQDGTAWAFMVNGALALGLGAEELPANSELITHLLQSGSPIIAIMGAGDFTTVGHFIVLTGIDEYGNVSVHDPNNIERTQRTWPLQDLMPQFRDLWLYY